MGKAKPEIKASSLKIKSLGYPNKIIRDVIRTSCFFNNEYQDNPEDERVIRKGNMMVDLVKDEIKLFNERLEEIKSVLKQFEETMRMLEYVTEKNYTMWQYYLKDWGLIDQTTTEIEIKEMDLLYENYLKLKEKYGIPEGEID